MPERLNPANSDRSPLRTVALAVIVAECFGANLARCRRRVGLSQEELSFRASLHRTQVGMLERGQRIPRIDTLIKLAGSLGVAPGELLEGLEWEPGETVVGSFEFPDQDATL